MPLDEPRWWYGPDGALDPVARLLSPAGNLYGRIAERRFRGCKPYRAMVPVICIGNFTAGGTGKTPLALLVGEHLTASGERPVFLTRGYRGKQTGPVWLEAARHGAEAAGDEPLLLARAGPVMIARDRLAGAKAIEQSSVPATVIVMDDGLQNPLLAKDLTIAVVDGSRGLGNGRVIPAGPLRAPLGFQLGLVEGIVVNGRGPSGDEAPILRMLKREFHGPVLEASAVPAGDVSWLRDVEVLAYAGIANPERFFSLLGRLGARVVDKASFADHHAFSETDAEDLLRRASARGATLVTTEKDHVRLAGQSGRRGTLYGASRTLPIRLEFDDRELTRLTALIDAALKTQRSRVASSQR